MTTFMSLAALASTVAQDQATPPHGHNLLAALPTDPVSIITVLLLLGSFVLVLWYGRPKGGNGDKAA
jgi:hypothetical protein